MASQVQAEMTAEEAEAVVAGAIAELPEVVSVHCEADGNKWILMTVHEYGDDWDAIDKITDKVIDIEDRVPHLYLEPWPVSAPGADAYTRGLKEIYRRR